MIGGLYWRHGTTLAAWITFISGAVLALTSIFIQQCWHFDSGNGLANWLLNTFHWEWVANNMEKFPINGRVISFYIMIISLLLYVSISLLQKLFGKGVQFNLEKMLHRGQYDTHKEHQDHGNAKKWERLLGITPEFTRGDKLIFFASLAWTALWFFIFIFYTLAYFLGGSRVDGKFIGGVDTEGWLSLWKGQIYVTLVLGVCCTLWLALGGIKDVISLFKRLKTLKRDDADNGFVKKDE